MKRVVVTGIGAITPLGKTVTEFWDGLVQGKSGAAEITRFDASNAKTKFACEVPNYNPEDYFTTREVSRIDIFNQYAEIAAKEAVEDSKINLETIDKKRAGVILGVGIGGLGTFRTESQELDRSGRTSTFFIPKMISNMAGGSIAIRYGLRGICFTTVTACASAANAIMDAMTYIRLGKADVMISGGSEACITDIGIAGFNALKALSLRNDDPTTASRPFDKDRDGFVMGEGAGMLILEEYEHAKRRGATIYAEVLGAASNCDAHHITAPHPEGLGAKEVMIGALEDAGLQPEDIDYINLHGTSTGLGDIAEPKAVRAVFGDHADKLSLSSIKSMIGHLLGAAGAVEAVASVLSIKNGIVPPTINHFTDDSDIEPLDFTFNKAKKREINHVISNNFGFGGHNATIVFGKHK